MKLVVLALMLAASIACAAKPEQGPYSPTMSSDFLGSDGELYPTALGVRPWKTEDPSAYSGQYVDTANPAFKVTIKVKQSPNAEWLCDGDWRVSDHREHPRTVSWTRAAVELDTKHTYAYGGRGTLFIFFVQYRDPNAKDGEAKPALMIGDHLFTRK
jgi:hypothetical protein